MSYKPTKEEIALCKKIAKKHRKKIVKGDWHLRDERLHLCCVDNIFPAHERIPLWRISDCLDFLEERGLNHCFVFKRFKNGNWSFTAEDNKYRKVRGEGGTRKAACQKAVLTILEKS